MELSLYPKKTREFVRIVISCPKRGKYPSRQLADILEKNFHTAFKLVVKSIERGKSDYVFMTKNLSKVKESFKNAQIFFSETW